MNDNGIEKGKNITDHLKTIRSWRKRFPIFFNIFLMMIAGILLLWIILIFLDHWTLHGEEAVIPDVRGENVNIAKSILQKNGMNGVISDSIFDTSSTPGTVVEQNPHPMSKVKPGRTVYLTIVAYTPKMVAFPDISNTSLRQGRSMLEGVGIKNIIINRVPSEYRDLVLGATMNGRFLRHGEKIPINSVITLDVGEGIEDGEQTDEEITDD